MFAPLLPCRNPILSINVFIPRVCASSLATTLHCSFLQRVVVLSSFSSPCLFTPLWNEQPLLSIALGISVMHLHASQFRRLHPDDAAREYDALCSTLRALLVPDAGDGNVRAADDATPCNADMVVPYFLILCK